MCIISEANSVGTAVSQGATNNQHDWLYRRVPQYHTIKWTINLEEIVDLLWRNYRVQISYAAAQKIKDKVLSDGIEVH